MYIGEVAHQTGCSVEIIRHYEKQSLLPPPDRTAAGYRVYSDEHVQRLRFIKRSRQLGFGLKEIAELVSLGAQSQLSCTAVDDIALRHLKETRHRINQLQILAAELEQIVASCQGGRIPQCRILERLSVPDSE